jgi:hypothetical protein
MDLVIIIIIKSGTEFGNTAFFKKTRIKLKLIRKGRIIIEKS